MGVLPATPGQRGLVLRVRVGQQPGVGRGQVPVPLGLGQHGGQGVPLTREDPAHGSGDPLGLVAGSGGDRGEHHRADAVGVGLGIDQAQRDSPGDADHDPAVDAQVLTQPLDVGDQVCGRVGRQVDVGVVGQWSTSSATTLVEQHRPVGARVEVSPRRRRAAAARAAVQIERRQSVVAADCLPVEAVPAADRQVAEG